MSGVRKSSRRGTSWRFSASSRTTRPRTRSSGSRGNDDVRRRPEDADRHPGGNIEAAGGGGGRGAEGGGGRGGCGSARAVHQRARGAVSARHFRSGAGAFRQRHGAAGDGAGDRGAARGGRHELVAAYGFRSVLPSRGTAK